MKKLLAFLFVAFLAAQAGAQTTDYLHQKDFQAEKKKIYDGINASKKQISEIRKADAKFVAALDSLQRKLTLYSGELARNADSLSKANSELASMKAEAAKHKMAPRWVRLLMCALTAGLLIAAFTLIYLFRGQTNRQLESLAGLDKKTNDRLDAEANGLRNGLQASRETINVMTAEMNQRIATGLASLESKFQQLEKQVKDGEAAADSGISALNGDIRKLKEDLSAMAVKAEAAIADIRKDNEKGQQGLAGRIDKLEKKA